MKGINLSQWAPSFVLISNNAWLVASGKIDDGGGEFVEDNQGKEYGKMECTCKKLSMI